MDQCHRDLLRKQSRLNLTPYVPNIDVGVCVSCIIFVIAEGFGHGAANDETVDAAINHPNKLQVRSERHATPPILNARSSSSLPECTSPRTSQHALDGTRAAITLSQQRTGTTLTLMNLHQHHIPPKHTNMPVDTSGRRAITKQCSSVSADEERNTRNSHFHHHCSCMKRHQNERGFPHGLLTRHVAAGRLSETSHRDAIHVHQHILFSLPQFVRLLEPHESVSSERQWRETCWAHHKPHLEGIGQRDGTLVVDVVRGKVQHLH